MEIQGMEFQSPLDKRRIRLTMVLYTPGQSSGYPKNKVKDGIRFHFCLLYTSPSPRDLSTSRMPSSA